MKFIILIFDLCIISYIDHQTEKIPNWLLGAGLACWMAFLPIEYKTQGTAFWNSLFLEVLAAIIVALGGTLCTIFASKAVGFGDIKLLIMVSLYLGLQRIFEAIFFALFLATVILILLKRKARKERIPFGPFLAVGTLLSLL